MNRFKMLLYEARKRVGLTQKELARKIDVHDTYISKLESGKESPPSRRVAEKMADTFGMSNKPLTLYVSSEDKDSLERFIFFLAAYVVGSEDVLDIRLVDVEGDEVEGEQAVPTALPSVTHPAMALSNLVLEAAFEQIETVFKSKHFSKEQMKRAATELVESANQITRLIKP